MYYPDLPKDTILGILPGTLPGGWCYKNGIVQPESEKVPSPRLLLSGDIDSDRLESIAEFVKKELDNSSKEVSIILFSYGGDTNIGNAIYDLISWAKTFGMKFTIVALGSVESAGVLILEAGDWRQIAPNCMLFIHPTMVSMSNRSVHANSAEILHVQQLDRLYAERLSARTDLNIEEIQEMRTANSGFGRYLSPDEALGLNFVDEILGK